MDTFGDRLKKIRKEKKLRQKDLAEALKIAQTTVANYEKNMRFPDQKKLNKIANYLNVSLDYLLGRKEENSIFVSNGQENSGLSLSQRSNNYLEALLNQDKEGARNVIQEGIANGVPITNIYLYVLEPALKELGRLWSLNRVNIAQEHFCSFVTQQIMAQILIKNPSSKEYKAVAMAVSGELHEIGLKMVVDFLEMDGWKVYYLGANTPTQSVIEAIEFTKADILVISATLPMYIDGIENLLKVVRLSERCGGVKILVGGQAFHGDPNLWKKIKADGYAVNGKVAVDVANELVRKGDI